MRQEIDLQKESGAVHLFLSDLYKNVHGLLSPSTWDFVHVFVEGLGN